MQWLAGALGSAGSGRRRARGQAFPLAGRSCMRHPRPSAPGSCLQPPGGRAAAAETRETRRSRATSHPLLIGRMSATGPGRPLCCPRRVQTCNRKTGCVRGGRIPGSATRPRLPSTGARGRARARPAAAGRAAPSAPTTPRGTGGARGLRQRGQRPAAQTARRRGAVLGWAWRCVAWREGGVWDGGRGVTDGGCWRVPSGISTRGRETPPLARAPLMAKPTSGARMHAHRRRGRALAHLLSPLAATGRSRRTCPRT